jgi:hypothetical protein
MRPKFKQIFHWLPRILAIIGVLFLSVFALDVFVEYETLSDIAVALTMHLMPSFLLIGATVVAWRWRILGGLLFIVLGFISIFFFNTYENSLTFMIVTLPTLVVGLLFMWEGLVTWAYREFEADIF